MRTQFCLMSFEGSLIAKGFVRCKGELYDLTHTFNGKYRRLRWDDAAPTVDTKFGDPRLFLHPAEDRGFTVREAACLQGFPLSFIFEGSPRQQHRMIGNAVPPPTAEIIARWIRYTLLS
jgi:DNA (cytosine-5)-methyltransferase 1